MDNNTNQPVVGKEPVEQEDKQKKRLQNVLEYAESLALVFAVMLLIFTFIARPATVDGESMLPTLENGERLVISHLFYEPSAGDIVVLCGEADQSSRPADRRSTSTLSWDRCMWTERRFRSRISSSRPIWMKGPSSL